eukprot:3928131-Amphidinium_carterae.1
MVRADGGHTWTNVQHVVSLNYGRGFLHLNALGTGGAEQWCVNFILFRRCPYLAKPRVSKWTQVFAELQLRGAGHGHKQDPIMNESDND